MTSAGAGDCGCAVGGWVGMREGGGVDEGLRVTDQVTVPRDELSWRFSRSSGPGGQSVNTADSRVELSFDLAATTALPQHLKDRAAQRLAPRLVDGVLTIAASEYRSQLRNRRAAEARLAALLADAIAPPAPPRRPTRPSRGAVQRRLDAKRRRAQFKRDRRPPE
jgi:ribosome-associated protein